MDELSLEPSFSLAEVVHKDKDLYQEVCQSFADLFSVAIKVFDDKGTILLDLPGPTSLCQAMFKVPPCRQACVHLVNSIRKALPAFHSIETVSCFTGVQYRMAPIHHGTDVIGKVLFGPFLPVDVQAPPDELLAMDRSLDSEAIWSAMQRLRRLSPRTADQIARSLATVIEVQSFVGFKGQVTTAMHVQALNEAFAEISEKNRHLDDLHHKLTELEEQRGRFLASISQELAAPLTSLIGYAEMLREGVGGALTPDQMEFISTIIDHGEQLMATTQTLAQLAAIERGLIEISPQPVAIPELLEQTARYGRELGGPREVQVHLIPPGDTLPNLHVDPDKARSVLMRIMDNAVKFTPAGGVVEVSAREDLLPSPHSSQDSGMAVITIEDNGIGIPPEAMANLFTPFFTVQQGNERTYSGTGVGLTIAKAYMDALGGQIAIRSLPGEGTEVSLFFPTTLRRIARP